MTLNCNFLRLVVLVFLMRRNFGRSNVTYLKIYAIIEGLYQDLTEVPLIILTSHLSTLAFSLYFLFNISKTLLWEHIFFVKVLRDNLSKRYINTCLNYYLIKLYISCIQIVLSLFFNPHSVKSLTHRAKTRVDKLFLFVVKTWILRPRILGYREITTTFFSFTNARAGAKF